MMRISVNSEFERLGFQTGINYLVYTKDLSRSTMLVVEGAQVNGYSEYLYTFYKCYFEKNKRYARHMKVYMTNEPALNVIKKVENYLSYLQWLSNNK